VNIKRHSTTEAPDINLIPLIDVLLVIVIFLVVSTTFVQPSALEVNLPGTQNAEASTLASETIRIRVGRDGNYALGAQGVLNENQLRQELSKMMSLRKTVEDQRAIVEADAESSHQSVVVVMDILASLGVARVSIATATGKSR
jgi:biopolymer transport protein ExbD